ncbi:MAG: transposase [Thermomicrobiales bacterium]|nr:transposase [Thermomicrobiales bacterium]
MARSVQHQVCREHNLSDGLVWRWRREYAARGEAAFSPQEQTGSATLERRIAELEQFLWSNWRWRNRVLKGLASARSRNDTP